MKPTESFNLLVTFTGHKTPESGEELLGMEEIEMALEDQKDLFDIKNTEFYNVALIQSDSDPKATARLLRDASTTVISKIVPVEMVVRTRKDSIVEKVISLSRDKIKANETFVVRGDIRGRGHIESKEDLLSVITQEITEKLLVEKEEDYPDWVVQIEVVGENTGISVLRPEDIIKKD